MRLQRIGTEVVSILVLSFVGALAPAYAESVPIYKCLDRNLGIVYTDVPCKDGEKLDLRAGDADPAAVARLERDREELNLAAAQRLADERRASLQRDNAYFSQPPVPFIGGPGTPDYSDYGDYGYGYGYPLLAYPNRMNPRVPRVNPFIKPSLHRFAPNPPFKVPRQ